MMIDEESSARLIAEENYRLLHARWAVNDDRKSDWLNRAQPEFKNFLCSLNESEIVRLSDVDYPIFTPDFKPTELAAYSTTSDLVNHSNDQLRLLIYESNLLILANRWRLSQERELDEIRFNTREPVFQALRRVTFSQIQRFSDQTNFLFKFGISIQAMQRLVIDENLTREQKNRIVINS